MSSAKSPGKLTTGPIAPTLFKLALPMLIGIMAVVGFNLVDTWFISRLGTSELAAISFTFPVVYMINSIAMGLGQGTVSVLSRSIGEGNTAEARNITTDSLILAVIVTAIFCTAGLFTINPLFRAMGASEELLPLIRSYMVWWYAGMPAIIIPMVGNYAIRATGDTRTPGMIMVVAVLLNAVLDPLFIFGYGLVPGLGLAGAAIATTITRAITMVLSLGILHYREHLLSWAMPSWNRFNSSCRQVLYVGLPAAGVQLLGPLTMAILTRLVATHGEAAVAAVGLGTRIEAFALLPMLSLSTVIIPFVGQNWGAKLYDRVAACERLTVRFSLIWGLGVWAIMAGLAPFVFGMFTDQYEVVRIVCQYLWIIPAGFAGLGIQLMMSSAFNAINRPVQATILSAVRVVTLCLLAWVCGQRWGLIGLFSGVAAGNIVGGVLAWMVSLTLPTSEADGKETDSAAATA